MLDKLSLGLNKSLFSLLIDLSKCLKLLQAVSVYLYISVTATCETNRIIRYLLIEIIFKF